MSLDERPFFMGYNFLGGETYAKCKGFGAEKGIGCRID